MQESIEGTVRVTEYKEAGAKTIADEEDRMRAEVKLLAMEFAGCKCPSNE